MRLWHLHPRSRPSWRTSSPIPQTLSSLTFHHISCFLVPFTVHNSQELCRFCCVAWPRGQPSFNGSRFRRYNYISTDVRTFLRSNVHFNIRSFKSNFRNQLSDSPKNDLFCVFKSIFCLNFSVRFLNPQKLSNSCQSAFPEEKIRYAVEN